MRAQTQATYDQMLQRFYGFCDGVIRSITVRYQKGGTREIQIDLSSRDSESLEAGGWVYVQIMIRNVGDYNIRDTSQTTIQVLSEGIHVVRLDDKVGVEFGGSSDIPYSVDTFKSADAYAIGVELDFTVLPY